MTGNFWGPSQVPFISTVKQFCENTNSFIHGDTAKNWRNLGISLILTCLHFTRWFSYYVVVVVVTLFMVG